MKINHIPENEAPFKKALFFTCAACGEDFIGDKSFEESYKESKKDHPELLMCSIEESSSVCENCFTKFLKWYNGLTQEEKDEIRNNVSLKKVRVLNKKTIPPENETISDSMKIDDLFKQPISDVEIYKRTDGNIIDIYFDNGEILCIKLPYEMKKDHFMAWAKPLIDKLEEETCKEGEYY